MTTDCLDLSSGRATRRLHDAILAFSVAVIIVIPAALGLVAVL